MAYVPNNLAMFTAAFAGALAGMGASDRNPTDDDPADYVGLTTVAGAFAQSFDTEWGATATTSLSIESAQQLCEVAWQDRSPINSAPFNTPGNYTGLSKALIAMITAGANYYAGQGIIPAPPPGPPGPQNSLIVPSLAALSLLDVSGNETDTTARVQSLQGTNFILDKASTLTPDGITVVPANGGGNWVRLSTDIPFYSNQPRWLIDPINGNDENDGYPNPIKTAAELNRRWGQKRAQLPGEDMPFPVNHKQISVHILSDLPDSDAVDFDVSLPPNSLLVLFGTPTEVGNGTLTNVIPPVGNATWIIEDLAVPDFTPYINRRIRLTSGVNAGAYAWITAAPAPNQAQITDPLFTSLDHNTILNINPSPALFSADDYVIERMTNANRKLTLVNSHFSSVPGVFPPYGLPVLAWQEINFKGSGIFRQNGFRFGACQEYFRSCTFDGGFAAGAATMGNNTLSNCLVYNGSVRHRATNTFLLGGGCNALFLLQQGSIFADYGYLFKQTAVAIDGGMELGAVKFFDIPGDAIVQSGNAKVALGSYGNLGPANSIVYGDNNAGFGLAVDGGLSAGTFAPIGVAQNIYVTGAAGDISLAGATTARAWDEATGAYNPALAATWANYFTPLPAGFEGNMHNVKNSCSLVQLF